MSERASGGLDRSDPLYAPGLKRRRRKGRDASYWVPPAKDIAAGFSPKSIALPKRLSESELAEACRKYWAELEAWRVGTPSGPERYTFAWLVDRYLRDELSPYQRLRFNSQRAYRQDCQTIRDTVGKHRIDAQGSMRILGEDIWRWHKNWGAPLPLLEDGKPMLDERGGEVFGLPRASRARHLITQLRILVKYAVAIGVPGAKDLRDILAAMEFPTTGSRTSVPDFKQVLSLVNQALKDGYRSIAIATLAQFEFVERRISIIGAWEGKTWRAGWVWDGVSGRKRVGISADWVITYTQNKVGEVAREFDLKATPLLLQLLQQTPEGERAGPVIVCETTGRPWREKHYTDTFREIARAAGLPDSFWSMDMRAGGATETDALPGITERDLKNAGGWSSDVYQRYTRAPQRRAQNVVTLRQRLRNA